MPVEPSNQSYKRRLCLGMVEGGPGAFIGAVHRIAARLDDRYELPVIPPAAVQISGGHFVAFERIIENLGPQRI